MSPLTLQGLEPELEQRLREIVRQEGVSLNQAAQRLTRLGAGLSHRAIGEGLVGDSLDAFFGAWTEAEARELASALTRLDQVDPEMWS